jgi:Mor family transcriptional regulator
VNATRRREAEIRAQITEALIRDVGVSERMAQPFVDSVMACFAGQRPYFPIVRGDDQVAQIRAALERGDAVKRVMSEYQISRRQLYRVFPGGLPKPKR